MGPVELPGCWQWFAGIRVFLHTYLNSVVIRVKEWYNPLEVRISMIDKICNEIKGRLDCEHIKKVGDTYVLYYIGTLA